jgi:hypothetical protein
MKNERKELENINNIVNTKDARKARLVESYLHKVIGEQDPSNFIWVWLTHMTTEKANTLRLILQWENQRRLDLTANFTKQPVTQRGHQ